MPTYPYNPDEIGTYKRFYDTLSEENEGDTDEIAEVLDWLDEDPAEKLDKSKIKGYSKKFLEAGIAFSAKKAAKGVAQGATAAASAIGSLTPSLVDNIVDITADLYYAARDAFSGRRIKTSATITVGIALGAAAGFVIGTFLLPGIGSAIGGTVGAALIGTLASVGGTIGLTILGAFGGSWLGTKISKYAFKHEKQFELSNRKTKRMKKYLGLSSKESEIINGYLVNRTQAVKSPTCKRYYKYLRKLLVNKPEELGLAKAAQFFQNELKLLERQRAHDGSPPELEKEIEAVMHIIKILSGDKTRGLRPKVKLNLKKIYESYEAAKSSPSTAVTPNRNATATAPAKRVKADVEGVQREFESTLSQHNYRLQKVSSSGDPNSNFFSHYEIYKGQQKVTEVNVSHHQSTNGANESRFTIEKNAFMVGKEECSEVLVMEARAYYMKTGDASPTILADSDDSIATRLMAAAIKADLTPVLDEAEYPEDTHEQRERKLKVITDAYAVAGRTPPDSRAAKRPRLTHEGH